MKVLQRMYGVGDLAQDGTRRVHAWYCAMLERPAFQATMVFDKDPELHLEVACCAHVACLTAAQLHRAFIATLATTSGL